MGNTVVHPMKLLNPVHYGAWIAEEANKIMTGGRSSFKSSTIGLKLVDKKVTYPLSNMVVLRQVGASLYKSVYSQIAWALRQYHVQDDFIFTKNPLQIIHKQWGTGFHFSGADKPENLKSMVIPTGFVSDIWFEEFDGFRGPEAIDEIEDTFIRSDLPDGLEVNTWKSWNPSRNPYHWSNTYLEQRRNDPDYYISHSTYKDDVRGFNSRQILRKIDRYRENDYDYYRWMYLGEVVGLGDNVYNMDLFKPLGTLSDLPAGERLMYLCYAADTGHQVSATACGCFGITNRGNVVLLDSYYYSPAGKVKKKPPSELTRDLYEFIDRTNGQYRVPILNRVIDSAEGGIRNQYYHDFGIRWEAVKKRKKAEMIGVVQDLLAQGRFYYLDIPSNEIFITENREYRWNPKTIHTDAPDVIKEKDHFADVLIYFAEHNKIRLDLRV